MPPVTPEPPTNVVPHPSAPYAGPRVLILAIDREWTGIARLPRALRAAGFAVAALCPADSFLAATRFLDLRFDLAAARPGPRLLDALAHAMREWDPVRVVPGDDASVRFLHRVVRAGVAGRLPALAPGLLATIASSLGSPETFDATTDKLATQRAALALGVAVPRGREIDGPEDARAFAAETGFPVVVKKSFGSAGAGVRMCANEAELLAVVRRWSRERPPTPLARFVDELRTHRSVSGAVRALKRWTRDSLERASELAQPASGAGLSLQEFVDGTPAVHTLVAHEGRVLAGFAAVKRRIHPPVTGPATVVRVTDRPDFEEAARRLFGRFAYSGFASMDFMIERETNRALFLEINPRPIPLTHLGAGAGRDLCAAWLAALTGGSWSAASGPVREWTVTLFPQEMRRAPGEPDLATDFHDVPLDDPPLLEALERVIPGRASAPGIGMHRAS